MAVIEEALRIAQLRRLGLSEPLLRLAGGECVDEAFRSSCLGPPYYVYHGARVPPGPLLVPLWDDGDTVWAVWEEPDGLAFISFSIEIPDEVERIARTEQGFWAACFDFLYECDLSDEQLERAAKAVGFRFLDRHLASRNEAGERLDTFEGHQAWLGELVAQIDREALRR